MRATKWCFLLLFLAYAVEADYDKNYRWMSKPPEMQNFIAGQNATLRWKFLDLTYSFPLHLEIKYNNEVIVSKEIVTSQPVFTKRKLSITDEHFERMKVHYRYGVFIIKIMNLVPEDSGNFKVDVKFHDGWMTDICRHIQVLKRPSWRSIPPNSITAPENRMLCLNFKTSADGLKPNTLTVKFKSMELETPRPIMSVLASNVKVSRDSVYFSSTPDMNPAFVHLVNDDMQLTDWSLVFLNLTEDNLGTYFISLLYDFEGQTALLEHQMDITIKDDTGPYLYMSDFWNKQVTSDETVDDTSLVRRETMSTGTFSPNDHGMFEIDDKEGSGSGTDGDTEEDTEDLDSDPDEPIITISDTLKDDSDRKDETERDTIEPMKSDTDVNMSDSEGVNRSDREDNERGDKRDDHWRYIDNDNRSDTNDDNRSDTKEDGEIKVDKSTGGDISFSPDTAKMWNLKTAGKSVVIYNLIFFMDSRIERGETSKLNDIAQGQGQVKDDDRDRAQRVFSDSGAVKRKGGLFLVPAWIENNVNGYYLIVISAAIIVIAWIVRSKDRSAKTNSEKIRNMEPQCGFQIVSAFEHKVPLK